MPAKLGRPAKSGFSPYSRQRSSGSITACNATPEAPRTGAVRTGAGLLTSSECVSRHELCSRRSPLHSPSPCASAPAAGAGPLLPRGDKIWFGISDTGDPADFGGFSQLARQAPGADPDLPHLGRGLPGVDRTLAGGAGAADPPLHHRRQQRRPRADHPAGDRQGLRRRVPDPPQQAVLGEEDARLHPAAGRAQPLPQRLRLLRLRRAAARRRPQADLVPAGVPAHVRRPPRRRQARE